LALLLCCWLGSGCAEAPCPAADDPVPDLGASADLSSAPSAFLDPAQYARELVLDARFPFAVTRRHPSSVSWVGARWGRHGGPLRTRSAMGGALRIVRAQLPSDRLAPLGVAETLLAAPSGLPSPSYLGELIDLTADRGLLSYTGSGAGFPGEVLLYSGDATQILDRADVNGFYSAATRTTQTATQIVYSALSGMSASRSSTVENGLYISELCGPSRIRPGDTCAPGRKLFGWDGYSGPVAITRDRSGEDGEIFVAASLRSGATSDAILAVRAQSLDVEPARLVEIDSQGTASLAAVPPTADKPGWLLGKSFDEYMPAKAVSAYAQAYLRRGTSLVKSGELVPQALQPGPAALGLSLLSDESGGLYVAVATQDGGVLLELARKD
jgi:hypothetical protein